MKRCIAALLALLMALCLSPVAFAQQLLARPSEAQIIYIQADDYEVYRGDFYLCALTSLERDEDDLKLSFDNSRIVLRDFFATRDARRSFCFSDGAVIDATDFDAEGRYTGRLYTGKLLAKGDDAAKSNDMTSENAARLTVTKRRGTNEITSASGEAVYGAVRAAALAAADEYTALGCSWNDVSVISFDMVCVEDGSVTVEREALECTNGVSVINRRPSVVHIVDSGALVPVARGRASVTYQNALGEELQRLTLRVTQDDTGALAVECICPECNANQGATMHMLPCGHYSCEADFDAQGHAVAECGTAGHCTLDGAEHATCKNCLKPLCNGEAHGTGVCQHQHTWQQVSYSSPTATTAGTSVAKCVTCGTTYTQTLPPLGG